MTPVSEPVPPVPSLPPVPAELAAQAADALPGRLRKRLDEFVARAATWPVAADGERITVRPDDEVTVTLTLTGGVVRDGDAVICSCLLAPNCLHRAAVLARAPLAQDEPDPAGPAPGLPDDGTPTSVITSASLDTSGATTTRATTAQIAAAGALWRTAAELLTAGLDSARALTRIDLLRTAHEARAQGLYRAAGAASRAAAQLRSRELRESAFRLDDLIADLRELLLVTGRLTGRASDPGGQPGRDAEPARPGQSGVLPRAEPAPARDLHGPGSRRRPAHRRDHLPGGSRRQLVLGDRCDARHRWCRHAHGGQFRPVRIAAVTTPGSAATRS